ncbi:MAG: hypothetical protein ACRBCI_14085 [Cellvibrionaceae bacterium]
MNSEKLYLVKEDLYRLGNSISSRLPRVRPSEITTMDMNGVKTIITNNNDVSVFTKDGLNESPLTGWAWEIKQGAVFPAGLKLVKRGSKGHHMIVPIRNMPLNQYVGLLEQVAIHCKKVYKKQA